jgi:SpoVK/Ycf46/Vps4 family AAA+-type ATPase
MWGDRIVIALLQELEFFESESILIATSNLPKMLDVALWRRFDLAIVFPKPTSAELTIFAKRKCLQFGIAMTKTLNTETLNTGNYADASRVVENAARRLVLGEANGSE